MAKRQIFAIIEVDDDKVFEESGVGPCEYIERLFSWFENTYGISLTNCLLADGDSDDMWERYIRYLLEWSFEQSGEDKGESPYDFNEWAESEEKGRAL